MTAANSQRRFAIPPSIVRMSVGVACAIVGVLIELGLDQVVGVAPWLSVAFSAGLLAAVLGGLAGGSAAAAIGFVAQAIVIPASFPSAVPLDRVAWPTDLAVAVLALVLGLWIRRWLLRRRRRPPGTAAVAALARARSTGDGLAAGRDPAAPRPVAGAAGTEPTAPLEHELLSAVRDLGTARTPVQVSDALARHAVALSGARGAIVYLRANEGSGYVARGRFGAGDRDAPEHIVGMAGQTAGLALAPGGPTGDKPLQLPFGRGPVPAGIIRFVGGPGPDRSAEGLVGPSRDPRAGPLVELLCLVAADALARNDLVIANRSAQHQAAGAAGRVGVLARLTAALVRATTVDEVARTVVDLAVDHLAAGFAVIHAPEEGTGRFRLLHARGYPAGLAAREALIEAGASGPATTVARDPTILEIHGEDGWRAAFPSASNVPAITGTRAITAIPMRAAGGLQGVLVIGWRDEADRAAADRDLLTTAADQGAQAIERAILQAHDEDARRFQEAFIAVVSHELRTPITTLLAGSRILRRRLAHDEASADLTADIEAEADRLARIVDDLLVLSRLERRHLTLGDEPVHLGHLLQRVVASEAARWPGHRMAIVPTTGSHLVRGDETYIEQVLRNLVSNAAKYSPAGSAVDVGIDESPAGEILVAVRDRGSGVEPAEVEELFSLFYRSPSTAASAAGAGIGLFVSRRLVAEMGGRIWARPRPDGGSEFGFALLPYPVDEADDIDGLDADPIPAAGVPSGGPARSGRQ